MVPDIVQVPTTAVLAQALGTPPTKVRRDERPSESPAGSPARTWPTFESSKVFAERVAGHFVADIADHQMEVALDQGLYRHLQFRKPGTLGYWFDVIASPGLLTINGDMGTFVFSRVDDMLTFFRGKADINPAYWAEKVKAGSGSGAKEFRTDHLVEQIVNEVESWIAEEFLDDDDDEIVGADAQRAAGLRSAVADQVLPWLTHESAAYEVMESFEHDGFSFCEAYEYSYADFGFHFLWSCHAIRYAVAAYDAHLAAQSGALEDAVR